MINYTDPVAFIEAVVNGNVKVITNRILPVHYSSKVELICDGPGNLSWQHVSDGLGDAMKIDVKKFPLKINKNGYSVLSIDKFKHSHSGFYTCLSSGVNQGGRETILITNGM